jgi:hypothetical protein
MHCKRPALNPLTRVSHRITVDSSWVSIQQSPSEQTQNLSKLEPRILPSKSVSQVTTYIRKKYDRLEKRNAFARGYQLSRIGNRHAFAERLDTDVCQASLSAEESVQRAQEPAWSLALKEARMKATIHQKLLAPC